MKVNQIYVPAFESARVELTGGQRVLAMMPPRKGINRSYALLESGEIVPVKGVRIAGVGVPRFLKDQGYEIPKIPNDNVLKLVDYLDQQDAVKLVENAAQEKAQEIQKTLGGQVCTYTAFSGPEEDFSALVSKADSFSSTLLSMSRSQINAALVKTESVPGRDTSHLTPSEAMRDIHGFNLIQGWVSPEDSHDEEKTPRLSDYGGPLEHAAFVLVNSGLASFVSSPHLTPPVSPGLYDARGHIVLKVSGTESEDLLIIAVDAIDELWVHYIRDDQVLYQRTGFDEPTLRGAIGCIAAALVRINEIEALKPRAKKAYLEQVIAINN